MAESKTLTQTYQYIKNATSPTSVSYTCEPEVFGGNLVAGHLRTHPGVFTEGTPSQSYGGANNDEDSNA